MRGISITAVLIGAIASLAIATLIFLLGVLLALITGFSIQDLAHPTPFREIPAVDAEVTATSVTLMILAPIGAGYIAGRAAGTNILVNAVLAAGGWTLMLNLAAFFFAGADGQDSTIPIAYRWFLGYGGPAFGLIGGYLAEVRLSQLATLPIDQRPDFSLRSTLIATGRWVLAFPIAALTYVVVLKLLLGLGAWVLSLPFAIMIAVLAGTAVTPPTQRRTAGIVFMGLAVLIPAEEVVCHWLSGAPESFELFYLTANLLGAALSYPFLHQSFPGIFKISQKWWWLAPAHYVSWTSDERNARRGLAITGGIVAILLYVVGEKLLEFRGADAHYAAPLAGVIAMALAVCAARPIYSALRPQEMRQADANAAMRLRRDQPL